MLKTFAGSRGSGDLQSTEGSIQQQTDQQYSWISVDFLLFVILDWLSSKYIVRE